MKIKIIAALLAFSVCSCTTTYDLYGRPVQSVDPGVATAGIASAGLLGYALRNSNNENSYSYRRRGYDPCYSRRYDRRYYFRPDACGQYLYHY